MRSLSRRLLSLSAVIFFNFSFVKASKITENFDIQNPENWKTRSQEIEQKLLNGKVVKIKSMREHLKECGKTADFEGQVYIVFLDNGLRCVFKVVKDGNESGEVWAYKFSKETGIGNVPPIVLRELEWDFEGNGVKTKRQFFVSLYVETKADLLKFKDSDFFCLLDKIDKNELNNFKIFNFVLGQWDVGSHNMLVSESKDERRADKTYLHPILIDNEGIDNILAVSYGEVPFVRLGYVHNLPFDDKEEWCNIVTSKKFPFDMARFCNETVKKELEDEYGLQPFSGEHNFVLFNHFYWFQRCNSETTKLIKKLMYPDFLPDKTGKSLQLLTKRKLFKILGVNEYSRLRAKQKIEGILERRDMILQHFRQIATKQ